MKRFVFLAIFATITIATVNCQYYENDETEDREARQAYNVPEDDGDENEYAERAARRGGVPYAALEPNSKGCARARYKEAYCGGYGVNNWCDTLCTTRGYPYSWCRPTYCVCHHGEDEGSYCKWTS